MTEPELPLIVQGDMTLLLEVASPAYAVARDALARFAELVKSPEHMHTYRISDLSLWNAASLGLTAEVVVSDLRALSRYPVPSHVEQQIHEVMARYGQVTLARMDDQLWLRLATPELAELLQREREVQRWLGPRISDRTFGVPELHRGRLKQALIHAGWPAADRAGYRTGEPLAVKLRQSRRNGQPFALRDYQREAAAVFHAGGDEQGGAGVIVLPCGAGKTIVGLAALVQAGCETLILTTSVTAARQWIDEILDKTQLRPDQVGEYTGQVKALRPVTVTTYQLVTYRRRRDEDFLHLDLFRRVGWGLVIYDEVHLLPAPVFSVTAEIQSCRRLGLTATLVREDGRQDDVFALIGPKRYDVPWKELENQGWIARATCSEVRLAMDEALRMSYATADKRSRHRLAATNPVKLAAAHRILAAHRGRPTLVIGMYLDQLRLLAAALGAPLITGQTAQRRRDKLFAGFRSGEIPVLVVSKVANFAVDLPDASVAIQVSGTFGSRQEEAQRLGRLLRPKAEENQAHFYSLVTRDTVEQEAAMHRQLFLVEQGYSYQLLDAEDLEQGLIGSRVERP
jgi:DNA excision repair protein ERCC-3